ncbi:hypothetical protein VNO78_30432 [Psophocarpus tetragonolobus]|uniref:Uncharacterized protein n=1 Tax=Psophocarpus tetragonolobus TaxID=3891 RepID=A0AAN9RXB3_PSOTE
MTWDAQASRVDLEEKVALANGMVKDLEDKVNQHTIEKLKPLELERDKLWAQEVSLKDCLTGLLEALDKTNLEIANQFVKGFNATIEQVKCLIEELDLSTTGPFNEVVDSEIV